MAHIKQARLFSRPVVALNMAKIGVLEGHGEPRKGDHFGALFKVQVIELCPSQRAKRHRG
jgi:hypothetical protein